MSQSLTTWQSRGTDSLFIGLVQWHFWLHLLQHLLAGSCSSLANMKMLHVLALVPFLVTWLRNHFPREKHLRSRLSTTGFPILHEIWEPFVLGIVMLVFVLCCSEALRPVEQCSFILLPLFLTESRALLRLQLSLCFNHFSCSRYYQHIWLIRAWRSINNSAVWTDFL